MGLPWVGKCPWDSHVAPTGVYVGPCHSHRSSLGLPLAFRRTSNGLPWDCSVSMSFPYAISTGLQCRPTEFQWLCSIPIGLPCDYIASLMRLLWVSHGSPLGLPCHTPRIDPSISHEALSLDVPWDSHGTSMGKSWASHGFTVFPRVYGSGPWTSPWGLP